MDFHHPLQEEHHRLVLRFLRLRGFETLHLHQNQIDPGCQVHHLDPK